MSNFKFEDNSVYIKDVIISKCFKWLEEASTEIQTQAERNTRVDTKNTKLAWKHIVDIKRKEGTIGNTLENAIWEETGTGEYAIHGDGRKGAWYVPVEGYTGKKPPTFNGKVEIVYGKDGTAFYKTNGKKPTRALTKAFETSKPKVESLAEEIFGGIDK